MKREERALKVFWMWAVVFILLCQSLSSHMHKWLIFLAERRPMSDPTRHVRTASEKLEGLLGSLNGCWWNTLSSNLTSFEKVLNDVFLRRFVSHIWDRQLRNIELKNLKGQWMRLRLSLNETKESIIFFKGDSYAARNGPRDGTQSDVDI